MQKEIQELATNISKERSRKKHRETLLLKHQQQLGGNLRTLLHRKLAEPHFKLNGPCLEEASLIINRDTYEIESLKSEIAILDDNIKIMRGTKLILSIYRDNFFSNISVRSVFNREENDVNPSATHEENRNSP